MALKHQLLPCYSQNDKQSNQNYVLGIQVSRSALCFFTILHALRRFELAVCLILVSHVLLRVFLGVHLVFGRGLRSPEIYLQMLQLFGFPAIEAVIG